MPFLAQRVDRPVDPGILEAVKKLGKASAFGRFSDAGDRYTEDPLFPTAISARSARSCVEKLY